MNRVHNAETLNALANSPDVRDLMFLGLPYPNQELDFSAWTDDPRNVCLIYDGFGAIFVWRGPGIYECHIMVRKGTRGSTAFNIGREMLAYMKEIGATLIWGQPSIYNRAAICYIRRMGLKSAGFGTDVVAGEVQYFTTELN